MANEPLRLWVDSFWISPYAFSCFVALHEKQLPTSLHFEMEWPKRSGRLQSYPEVEEARWLSMREARRLMLASQLPLLDALEAKLKS